jgi:hypothetical protein
LATGTAAGGAVAGGIGVVTSAAMELGLGYRLVLCLRVAITVAVTTGVSVGLQPKTVSVSERYGLRHLSGRSDIYFESSRSFHTRRRKGPGRSFG